MIPKIIRSGLEVTSGNILNKGFVVINILLLTSFLEIRQFGLFMLMITISNVSTQLAIFSLHDVVYKLVGMHSKERPRFVDLASVLFSASFTSMLVSAILLVFSSRLSIIFLAASQISNLQIAILIIVPSTLTNVTNSILIGFDGARKSMLVAFLEVSVRTFGLLVLLYFHGSIQQALLVYLAASVISLCLSAYFVSDVLQNISFWPSVRGVRKSLATGRSFFASSLAVILIFNVDRLMLGAMQVQSRLECSCLLQL
jgi:O-antigen/teichoic acid export membrane protein